MGELIRIGPLRHALPTVAADEAIPVVPLLPTAQFIFRGRDMAVTNAGAALGFPFPHLPCRSQQHSGRSALWLGPDEFLLLGSYEQALDIETQLAAALRHTPHSLVDVSHRNVALQISGRNATALLNAGCPLDLDDSVFPVGACTRTVLAKAQVILWHTGPDLFYLNTWRSFAAYVWAFLAEAMRGCA